jgi:hypothetical protein
MGGQGSSALSRPMREDSPAAKITPAKEADRGMQRTIAENQRESQGSGLRSESGSEQEGCGLTGGVSYDRFVNLSTCGYEIVEAVSPTAFHGQAGDSAAGILVG